MNNALRTTASMFDEKNDRFLLEAFIVTSFSYQHALHD